LKSRGKAFDLKKRRGPEGGPFKRGAGAAEGEKKKNPCGGTTEKTVKRWRLQRPSRGQRENPLSIEKNGL